MSKETDLTKIADKAAKRDVPDGVDDVYNEVNWVMVFFTENRVKIQYKNAEGYEDVEELYDIDEARIKLKSGRQIDADLTKGPTMQVYINQGRATRKGKMVIIEE